ncbi:MAG: flagellar hook-associated protein FlgK [Lachnospiraceae bacterium]|nr:flagellar hook-associated protein FlgK [Lachnospiraceae bacterium]
MSLFGALSVGTSGLKISQRGLNVVAHNLANVDTDGFVRQQTVLDTSTFVKVGQNAISPMMVGLGVDTETVRQVRDIFLDKTYRQEYGRQGYYEAQRDAVDEIENLFGELQGVAFQSDLNDFWVALQELSKEPDSRVAQATLVETSISFLERADKIYEQLKKYQLDLNTQIQQKVDRINEIGERINELNHKISFYEANKVENANDLRDERNALLDELGGMVKVTYNEIPSGKILVSIEDQQFVSEDMCFNMGTMTMSQYKEKHNIEEPLDEASGILLVTWPHLGDAEVFDWSRVPSTPANTDIGSLKGAIQARGTAIGKYVNIPIEPKVEDFYDEDGTFNEEEYKLAMDQFEIDTEEYNLHIDSSIMMRTQSQFDQLIHGIITTINDALCPNKEVMVAAGTTITREDGTTYTFEEDTLIKVFDEENAPVGVDADATPGVELFSRKTVSRYTDAQDITLADGTVLEGARIYNWEDNADNYTLYTLGEVEINPEIINNKSKLPIISNNGSGDYDMVMVEKLLTKWQEPFATLSPNDLTYNNFNAYYTAFTGAIANRGDEYDTLAMTQEDMVNSVQDKRVGIMGVSSDEELTNLIKFQHAYNASARYINVIDEMLEHIIERLGS